MIKSSSWHLLSLYLWLKNTDIGCHGEFKPLRLPGGKSPGKRWAPILLCLHTHVIVPNNVKMPLLTTKLSIDICAMIITIPAIYIVIHFRYCSQF